jgi:similar to stage IV sporulation protein
MDDLLYKINNKIKMKISGKNVIRFVKNLINLKIQLLNVKYIDRNEVVILVFESDYKKIKKIKTIYEIVIIDYHGKLKFKKMLNVNKYLILSIIIGFFCLYTLTNIIFEVEVAHSNSSLRIMLLKELDNFNIRRLSFKKDYNSLQAIEKIILKKYKDKIEWLEIEQVGVKCIVKVEERKIINNNINNEYQDIVAGKNGVIKYIESSNGDIVKNINDYVAKNEVVISGKIMNKDNVVNMTKAIGKVYAEVWYKSIVEYPLIYNEEYKTLNKKTAYYFKIVTNNFALWDYKPYKNKLKTTKKLIYNKLLPIEIIKENQQEIRVIKRIYSKEEAIEKAKDLAYEKMKTKLTDNEKILSQKTLKIEQKSSRIIVEIFFKVYEDISVSRLITVE